MLQRSFCLATVDRGPCWSSRLPRSGWHLVWWVLCAGESYVLRPGRSGSDGRDRRII